MVRDAEATPLQVSEAERRRRWRLVLGGAAGDATEDDPSAGAGEGEGEGDGSGAGSDDGGAAPDGDVGGSSGGDGDESGGGDGEAGDRAGTGGDSAGGRGGERLSGDDARIDAALGALYDREQTVSGRRAAGSRAGGLGRSKPGVVRWLGDIRTYFPKPVVQVLQRDAVERLDLRQMLLEPELLDEVTYWREQYWQYALFAAVAIIRECAARSGTPLATFVAELADHSDINIS